MLWLTLLWGVGSAQADDLLQRGLSLRAAGELPQATEAFEAAAQASPAEARLWVELAVTRAWAGEHAEALDDLARALALDPELRGAHILQARVLGWAGRYREAEACWAALLEEAPGDPELLSGAGSLALARGRPAAAATAFEAALAHAPENEEARAGLDRARSARRGELRVGLDGWQWLSAPPALGGHAEARFRPGSRLSLRLSGSGAAAVGPDLSPAGGTGRRGEVEAAARARGGASLTVGGVLQDDGSLWVGLPISAEVPVGAARLGVGWRPGLRAGAHDQLASVSVGVGAETWAQARAVYWWDRGEQDATSGVLTVGTSAGEHALRLDLSLTDSTIGWLSSASAGWESGWWDRHAVSARAEVMTGAASRAGLSVSWRVALP